MCSLLSCAETPHQIETLVLERTDRNPFFIEEVLRTLIESGALRFDGDRWVADGDVHDLAIPNTLLATVHVARHEFRQALSRARTALDLNPADAAPQAVAGDALLELGDYDEAARTYARLASLTGPRNPAGRLAWLRFLQGDPASAVAGMRQAVATATAANPIGEPTAWTRVQLGELLFHTGDLAGAEAAYRDALAALPGYHAAIAGTARVAAARGRLREAADHYHKALDVVPLPEYAAALGDVYTRIGREPEARKQYALVEYIGRLSALNKTVYNRELALFLADHDLRLPEALELARKELEARRDIYTYDVLAWALYKNGQAREAQAAMTEASIPTSTSCTPPWRRACWPS